MTPTNPDAVRESYRVNNCSIVVGAIYELPLLLWRKIEIIFFVRNTIKLISFVSFNRQLF
jgi:hypothetical protein